MTEPTARALVTAFRILAATWRFEVSGGNHLRAVQPGPFVFALWHHTLLPLLWWHRRRGITLMVSRHRDGELVARAAVRMGYRLSRGSSTRGGAEAYRGILRALASGSTVAITPDGPAGPPRLVKPGVVRVARRAGVPVLPVAAQVDCAWRLGSWDSLIVPRPFARVVVRYGTPLAPDAPLDASAAVLRTTLDALVGGGMPQAT